MAIKVLVSGFFDLLHSGHIAFFREAAGYGDVYVAVGSDETYYELKGRAPVNPEHERLFMVKAVGFVKDAVISRGTGILDFQAEMRRIDPDIFIVNDDGNVPAKRQLCAELGVEYIVLRRDPHASLPRRSSTGMRSIELMPYRIDLAGGWLDQPYVSKYHPGSVITLSIEPTVDFNERSGMATSTRVKALDLWGSRLPAGDPEKLAYVLFCYDNPPGTKIISGSQDAIGIVMPGLNKAYYEGQYWPSRIDKVRDKETMLFIEQSLYLIPLGPREPKYSVLDNTDITAEKAKALAEAAEACWDAILARDLEGFGRYMRAGFEGQIAMFPNMFNETIGSLIEKYRGQALGWKISGAGGGGYLILVSAEPVEDGFQILVRNAPG
ncbi:MAG: adenylyltransferase/cytidyltransferase family protein [Anaerolineae bacterium]|nr:adenylyltransferase/cytidyltransferase family protein [Anaerolineae bacterium]